MTAAADHFAAVPAAWEDRQREFNPTARAVYVQLLMRMNRKSGVVRLSLRALEDYSGLKRSSIDRGLMALEEGGVIRRHKGTNQHSGTEIEVLLRRSADPPAGQQRDSTTHGRDSVTHQRDTSGTAHHLSPAGTRDRGLRGYPDEEEGADSRSDLPASGSDGEPTEEERARRLAIIAENRRKMRGREEERVNV